MFRCLWALALLLLAGGTALAGETVDAVLKRGGVNCGSHVQHFGFASQDESGRWVGFDADFCRAVAAAVVKDANRVHFVPLSTNRFEGLEKKEVDLLSLTVTWTLTRDGEMPFDFAAVTFYDGQGFLAFKEHGWKTLADAGNAAVCVEDQTTTVLNVRDYIKQHGLSTTVKAFTANQETRSAFFTGECGLYTGDASALASIRAFVAPDPENLVILKDQISKEPLSLLVRQDDSEWFDMVKWTVYATIQAEEWGITAANIDQRRASAVDPAIRRFLGVDPGVGKALGLDDQWAYRIVKQVGNYGEIFDRNLGGQSPLKLERGLNDLWSRGGLMYAMPFR